jgi:uncharacterized protein YndB with AHSA1/START domain
MENSKISIETTINAPLGKVWDCWTNPNHIVHWNFASDDWHCPKASNNLQAGGEFSFTMAAKDGSMSFDFGGVYDAVEFEKSIEYTLGDGRRVSVNFEWNESQSRICEIFDPENVNPVELQQAGWQAILNNFKKYVESA